MKNISFYKPNPKVTGCAASFSFKNGECYMNMAKQVGWDTNTKKGSFKSDNAADKLAIKFNQFELGSIIRTILYGEDFSTVHMFEKVSTSITIKQYTKKNNDKAIGISISKNKQRYNISLDMNEATVLWVFCQNVIWEMSEAE